MTNREKFEKLEAYVKTKIPGFEIRFKDFNYSNDPWYKKIADAVGRKFAPEYDTRYATTMYPFVYIPRDKDSQWGWMYEMLRHEYIHLRDMQAHPIWFPFSYVAIAPVYWTMRSYWEYRGYAQNLISDVEKYGTVREETIIWMTEAFSDQSYAWMDPSGAVDKVLELADQANTGKIKGLWPWDEGDFTTV